jgi:hypothetical protein
MQFLSQNSTEKSTFGDIDQKEVSVDIYAKLQELKVNLEI